MATSTSVAAGELGARDITLAASGVDTVTFARDCAEVEVLIVTVADSTNPLYFTVDNSTPTVSGKNTYEMVPFAGNAMSVEVPSAQNTVVKIISAGGHKYSVTGSL